MKNSETNPIFLIILELRVFLKSYHLQWCGYLNFWIIEKKNQLILYKNRKWQINLQLLIHRFQRGRESQSLYLSPEMNKTSQFRKCDHVHTTFKVCTGQHFRISSSPAWGAFGTASKFVFKYVSQTRSKPNFPLFQPDIFAICLPYHEYISILMHKCL